MPDNFARVVSPTKFLHLLEDSGERGFRLFDRDFGVVLAVLFEAAMMFPELLAEEFCEALTSGAI